MLRVCQNGTTFLRISGMVLTVAKIMDQLTTIKKSP